MLITTVGAAGLAILSTASCSKNSGTSEDAGACQTLKDDAGFTTCSPGCEMGLVPTSSNDGAVSTAKCVPKKAVDASTSEASATDVSGGEAAEESEAGLVSPQDATALDATNKSDAAGPMCSTATKLRANASVGGAWEMNGFPCNTNGSPSEFTDGDSPKLKTDTGEKVPCSAAVTNQPELTVNVTCEVPSQDGGVVQVVFTAVQGGCVKSAGGVSQKCPDDQDIALDGNSTQVSQNGSESVMKVTGSQQSDRLMLSTSGSAAGSAATTKGLDSTGNVKATGSSCGVGADGSVAFGGQIAGPTSMTFCCAPLPLGQSVPAGAVALQVEGSQTNMGPNSAATASPVFGGAVLPDIPVGGSFVVAGQVTTLKAAMTNGTYGAIEIDGQAGTCVIPAGQDSNTACGQTFNGGALALPAASAVHSTGACPVTGQDGGAKDAPKGADVAPTGPVADASAAKPADASTAPAPVVDATAVQSAAPVDAGSD